MIPFLGALRSALAVVVAVLALAAVRPAAGSEPPRLAAGARLDPMVAESLDRAWQAAAAEPQSAAAWFELGALYHAHELTSLAAECYREAVRLAPGEPRAVYLLAHAEWELGELEPAVERLARVAELVPEYAPASALRGRWLFELGRLEEAARAWERAVAADPGATGPKVGRAEIHLSRGEERAAIALLREVLAAEPRHGRAAQLLGAALRQAGEAEAARRILLASAGTATPDRDPWLEAMRGRATGVGNILRRLSAEIERGAVQPAIAELTELRAGHPGHVGLLNKLAEAHLAARAPEPAIAALEEALAADPDEFATLIHLAQAERMRGNQEAALEWANRAVLANPRLWHGPFERGGLLCAAGRWRECLAALDRALELGGHANPNLWLLRGEAYLQLGDWGAAAETFSTATRRFPFLDQAFVGLAYARAEQGRLAEAAAALDAAAELAPEEGAAAALRARLAERTGGG